MLDIWHINFSDYTDTLTLNTYLNQEENIKSLKFVKENDKNSYIKSHALLRIILSSYLDINPSLIEFECNEFFKPKLAKKYESRFYFNLSHTTTCAYVIVSTSKNCGIDVEDFNENIKIDTKILDMILSQEEEKNFYKASKKKELFFTYWTLKEAYLKAKGTGFLDNPRKIDFSKFCKESESYQTFMLKKDRYFTYNFDDKTFLSFVLLDKKEPIQPKFYSSIDLHKK